MKTFLLGLIGLLLGLIVGIAFGMGLGLAFTWMVDSNCFETTCEHLAGRIFAPVFAVAGGIAGMIVLPLLGKHGGASGS